MCAFWNMDVELFESRRKKGWTVKDALTKPADGKYVVTDHLGNSYKSMALMAEAYKIDFSTLRTRLKSGLSLEEALTESVSHTSNRTVEDHKGNRYSNISEMCRHWKISRCSYDQRRRKGWTLERILTTPMARPCAVKDHTGREHKSFRAMCKAWGMNHRTVKDRLRKGESLMDALQTPAEKRVFRSHLNA